MFWIIIFGAVVCILVLLIQRFGSVPNTAPATLAKTSPQYRYQSARFLLSDAEASFYRVLFLATGDVLRIFPKVRLADVVQSQRGLSRSGWKSHFNRIAAKHIDFVNCRADTLEIVGAIELDDKSHKTLEQGVRDLDKDTILADAGIPVLRVKAAQDYQPEMLRRLLAETFRLVHMWPSAVPFKQTPDHFSRTSKDTKRMPA